MVKEKLKKNQSRAYNPYEKKEDPGFVEKFTSFLSSFIPSWKEEEKKENNISETFEEEDIWKKEIDLTPIKKPQQITLDRSAPLTSKLKIVTPVDIVKKFLRKRPKQEEEEINFHSSTFKPFQTKLHSFSTFQQEQEQNQSTSMLSFGTPTTYRRKKVTDLLTPGATLSDLKRKRETSFMDSASRKTKIIVKNNTSVLDSHHSVIEENNSFLTSITTPIKQKNISSHSDTAKQTMETLNKLFTPISDTKTLSSKPLSVRLDSIRRLTKKKEERKSSPPPPNKPMELNVSPNFKNAKVYSEFKIIQKLYRRKVQKKKQEEDEEEVEEEEEEKEKEFQKVIKEKEKELSFIPVLKQTTSFFFDKSSLPAQEEYVKQNRSNSTTKNSEKDIAQVLFGDANFELDSEEDSETKEINDKKVENKETENLFQSSFGKQTESSFSPKKEEKKEKKTEEKSFSNFYFGGLEEKKETGFSFGTEEEKKAEIPFSDFFFGGTKEKKDHGFSFSGEDKKEKTSFGGFSFDEEKRETGFSFGGTEEKEEKKEEKKETKPLSGFSFGDSTEEKKEENTSFSFSFDEDKEEKKEKKKIGFSFEEKKEESNSLKGEKPKEEKKEEKEDKPKEDFPTKISTPFNFMLPWLDNSCHLDTILSILAIPFKRDYFNPLNGETLPNDFRELLEKSFSDHNSIINLKKSFWLSHDKIKYDNFNSPAIWVELIQDFTSKILKKYECSKCQIKWDEEKIVKSYDIWIYKNVQLKNESPDWKLSPEITRSKFPKCECLSENYQIQEWSFLKQPRFIFKNMNNQPLDYLTELQINSCHYSLLGEIYLKDKHFWSKLYFEGDVMIHNGQQNYGLPFHSNSHESTLKFLEYLVYIQKETTDSIL
jgi:hypothetical protein